MHVRVIYLTDLIAPLWSFSQKSFVIRLNNSFCSSQQLFFTVSFAVFHVEEEVVVIAAAAAAAVVVVIVVVKS